MLAIQVSEAEGPQPDGSYTAGWLVGTFYTKEEMEDLLSRYTPGVGTSPGVTDARPIARCNFDAVLAKLQGGA
jgi:hypothetical protein